VQLPQGGTSICVATALLHQRLQRLQQACRAGLQRMHRAPHLRGTL